MRFLWRKKKHNADCKTGCKIFWKAKKKHITIIFKFNLIAILAVIFRCFGRIFRHDDYTVHYDKERILWIAILRCIVYARLQTADRKSSTDGLQWISSWSELGLRGLQRYKCFNNLVQQLQSFNLLLHEGRTGYLLVASLLSYCFVDDPSVLRCKPSSASPGYLRILGGTAVGYDSYLRIYWILGGWQAAT